MTLQLSYRFVEIQKPLKNVYISRITREIFKIILLLCITPGIDGFITDSSALERRSDCFPLFSFSPFNVLERGSDCFPFSNPPPSLSTSLSNPSPAPNSRIHLKQKYQISEKYFLTSIKDIKRKHHFFLQT